MTVQKLNTPPNLPARRMSTDQLTLETVQWHYALADCMAAEADAMVAFDRTPSTFGFAAQLAANIYLDEWARLKLAE